MRWLFDQLTRRTLWQVLAIYLGGSWVLLQIVDLFVDNLGLPDWVFPASFLLLLLGLPIVLTTLFIQHRLSSTGEVADDVHEKLFTWRNAFLGGALAFLLLFGFAGLYVVVKDRGAAFSPAEAMAGEALPGIAILPFAARGPDAAMWREGVMDVLATNMSGISGIRAISPGTTMARWAELAPESGVVDEATELRIARATGARYVVSGSFIATEDRIRLVGQVIDLADGRKLGQAVAEGPAASPFGLVDEFSVEVIRLIGTTDEAALGESAMDLEALTTSDPSALRHYLRGLGFDRIEDKSAAAAQYDSAVARDSTFALALYRLGLTLDDIADAPDTRRLDVLMAAKRHAPTDRLSLAIRSALAMNYAYGFPVDDMDPGSYETVIRELEAALRADPSDAELWHRLGELYFHEQSVDPEWDHRANAQSALERAVELEPGINEYAFHLFELALQSHDADLFRRILDAGEAAAPGAEALRGWHFAYRAVFGDASGPELIAIVDSIAAPDNVLSRSRVDMVVEALAVSRWADAEAVVDHIRDRLGACWPPALDAGKFDWYLADLKERAGPGAASCAYGAYAMGLPVPERLLDSLFEATPANALAPLYALDRGRADAYETALGDARQALEARRATFEDTVTARITAEDYNRYVRTYEQWKVHGRLTEAEREILAISPRLLPRVALAEIRTQAGDAAGAARVLAALADSYGSRGMPRSLALYRLGPLYEELGREAKARAAYAEFLQRWNEADPALQPMADSARAALTRLGPLDQ